MQSPLALILDDDDAAREKACETLAREGIAAVGVASPREAIDLLRTHPAAVLTLVDGRVTPSQIAHLKTLSELRARDARPASDLRILGQSDASRTLRRRVEEVAAGGPVLFWGEPASGRTHAARSAHAMSSPDDPFVVVPPEDPAPVEKALAQAEGTVFLAEIDRLPWAAQEALAAAIQAGRPAARLMASSALDPREAVEDGRFLRGLLSAFEASVVRVPALRERTGDVGALARTFIDDLCRLNNLPPIALSPDAEAALARFPWPGNVRQLRSALESAVILAEAGAVRARDLPEFVRASAGAAVEGARADRRFRDAKRTVVEAFERAYLEELLRRHRGNVTGAAEQSGMLRSALQRLLRKHDLHSADFRTRSAPGRYVS